MILKFGKHKGKELSQVPTEYLFWLIENTDVNDVKYGKQNQHLVTECHRAINGRTDGYSANTKPAASVAPPNSLGSLTMAYVLADMRELIDKIYENADQIRKTMDIFESKFVTKQDPI